MEKHYTKCNNNEKNILLIEIKTITWPKYHDKINIAYTCKHLKTSKYESTLYLSPPKNSLLT